MKKIKKPISVLLSLMMVIGLFSVVPFTAGAEAIDTAEISFDANGGSGTMNPVTVAVGSSYTLPECSLTPKTGEMFYHWSINGNTYVPGESITVSGNTTVKAEWGSTSVWDYTTVYIGSDMTISKRIEIVNTVTLKIAEGKTLTAPKGIHVPKGSNFVIQGNGNLIINKVASEQAGIGGNNGEFFGSVTIQGGNVTVTGGSSGAGIGCGSCPGTDSKLGRISINGGNVRATGGFSGAGIGGGLNGCCKSIIISSGTVTAIGGEYGAGIGSGEAISANGLTSGQININGNADVTATGGKYAAGIGGGRLASCDEITLSGGTVKATGGNYGSGIGGGNISTGGTIKIGHSNITAVGGMHGAGIGGGENGNVDTIEIQSGNVTAKGGSKGAGIGSGSDKGFNSIEIWGGAVTATGGAKAADIGSGYNGYIGNIYIYGGNTTAANNTIGAYQYDEKVRISILLRWSGSSDSIYSKEYCGTVTAGNSFITTYSPPQTINSGRLGDNPSIIAGKTLVPPKSLAVNITQSSGGTVTTDHHRAFAGETVNLTCTPNAGCSLNRVTLNSNVLTGENGVYSFIMGNTAASVNVEFDTGYYTVTWKNGDTVLETDRNVEAGTTPHYDGATPEKAGGADYSYTFTGWSPKISPVSGDITYTAQFKTIHYYTITWKNGNTVLETDEHVAEGTSPHYDGATPEKESDNANSYFFSGWSPKISAVTGDVTYTATFAPDPAHFSQNGDTYTIHDAAGWDIFCDLLADNTKGYFDGKTVKLDADIEVTRMAGSSHHDFTGTFDGQGHTLTVAYGTFDEPVSNDDKMAPFRNAETGCVIKNLHTAGTIYTSKKYAGGIIGTQYGTVKIENCRSSVTINSLTEGDGTHGGFVGNNGNGSDLTIDGCVFDGKILSVGETATTSCSGFVGYKHNSGTITLTNCVYDPAALEAGETEVSANSATFVRNGSAGANCYYTRTLGTAQGKAARTVTAGENVTFALSGEATEYTVSGITAYANNSGLKYGDTYFAGDGDSVSLTIDHTTPTGYFLSGYTASAGELNGNTLTMPDENVTVSASFRLIGDVNNDGALTIRDVTAIQRHVSEFQFLEGDALIAADTTGNGVITIDDATHLQMYLAEYGVVLGQTTQVIIW